MPFKSGFVAIIGRPNAGKSTLLNTILGEKIAIVSEKPQTTRNTIRGVKNLEDCQAVFIDTPGLHRAKGLLNEFMVREALGALDSVDLILYMVDAEKGLTGDDRFIIGGLKKSKAPVVLLVNKVDRVGKPLLLPLIKEFSGLFGFKEIVPISALTGDGVDVLMKIVSSILPEGPEYFPKDTITDQPVRFIAAEIIREKVFILTKEEVPYSTAVTIEAFKEDADKGLIVINAVINVERDSQKGIIIGKGGSMLKRIGTAAREDMEALLGARVYLELFVRVEKDWTRRPGALKEFGY